MFWQQLNINIKIFREETPVTRLDNYHLFCREETYSRYSEKFTPIQKPQTVPWLNGLVAGLSQRRSKFDPKPLQMQFVLDEVTIWQASISVLRTSSVVMIPPIRHTRMSFFYHRRYIILETESFDTETLLSLTKPHGFISQKAVSTHLFCPLQNNNY